MKKKRIQENYDNLGGRIYDIRYTEEQEKKYGLIMAELKTQDTDLVLDNGCGTGLLFPFMNTFLIGLDLSSKLLKQALKQITETTFLINGDSENLPIRNTIFDKIISVTVIQNTDDPHRMISDSMRTLKNNGEFAFTGLKKAYTKQEFQSLFEATSLEIRKIIDEEKIHDWIVIGNQ
jgi:ubiquinone/menaquinone biosynthesis C-methylase UbiE